MRLSAISITAWAINDELCLDEIISPVYFMLSTQKPLYTSRSNGTLRWEEHNGSAINNVVAKASAPTQKKPTSSRKGKQARCRGVARKPFPLASFERRLKKFPGSPEHSLTKTSPVVCCCCCCFLLEYHKQNIIQIKALATQGTSIEKQSIHSLPELLIPKAGRISFSEFLEVVDLCVAFYVCPVPS